MERRLSSWSAAVCLASAIGCTQANGASPAVGTGEDDVIAAAVADPGPRTGAVGAGDALANSTAAEVALFGEGRETFKEIDSVSGGIAGEEGKGLGPTFNHNSCAGCHAEPVVGGSSPHPTLGFVKTPNPQIALATLNRISPAWYQKVPSFITADGPVREARFVKNADGTDDGGVHGLFTIAGRIDAPDCRLAQPDFAAELANDNVIFRIPTPTYGLGLIEAITDDALSASFNATTKARSNLGIGGRFNRSGNDGTITRFGWKAQNKSLLIFAGEAYNVEQGVSNEVFPDERTTSPGCNVNPTPEDKSDNESRGSGTGGQMASDTVNFANFMRLAAPPKSATASPSETNGAALFASIGCALCHTPTLATGPSRFAGLSNVTFHPYSDVAIHHMGPGLADHVAQGGAGADEFRSAPLWGVGQRIFFLHDGRAGPKNGGLVRAILAHQSTNPNCRGNQKTTPDGVACRSEANQVIDRFRDLRTSEKQDVVNFLRSL